MFRTYRYPLLIKGDQLKQLEELRAKCCELYNAALQERRDAWRKQHVSVSFKSQSASLTEIRANDPEWAAVSRLACAQVLRRLDAAFGAFFRRVSNGVRAGSPRFKSTARYDSVTIGRAEVSDDRVMLPKIGWVRFKKYRPIGGSVRNVNLWRDPRGRWFVCLQCDLGEAPKKIAVRNAVGIDLGITNLVVLSDGTHISNPRHMESGQALVGKRQRSMERKRKGSKRRHRARVLFAMAHAKVRNQRRDHINKIARRLVSSYDLICHEDLNIAGLTMSVLSKHINNMGWGSLLRQLANKAEEAGKHIVAVDPRGTSQRCSGCQQVVRKLLSERTHDCPHCGLRLDRDENAAVNILALGMSATHGYAPG
jgi:putative transposase